MSHAEDVELLLEMTGLADASQAEALLGASGGSLGQAVALFFDQLSWQGQSPVAQAQREEAKRKQRAEAERRDERAMAVVFGLKAPREGALAKAGRFRCLATARRRSGGGLLSLDQSIMRKVLQFLVRVCLHFSLDECFATYCCFSPDGRTILCASDDKTLKLIDAATGRLLKTLSGHTAGVRSCCFSPDGKILSGGKDTKLILWDEKGELQETFVGHSNVVRSCCFSPDGTTFLADFRRTLKVYDAAKKTVLHILEGHFSDNGVSCYSPDGKQILGVDGQSLKLWDAKTGQQVHTLYGHSDDVSCCCFHPDGSRILSGGQDCDLILWDAVSGQKLLDFEGHSSSIASCTFNPSGEIVVSSSLDNTIRFWNTATGLLMGTLKGHTSRVHSAVFSPDGSRLLSSSGSQLKLWNASTMNCLQTLPAEDDIRSFCFSPDGAQIACASDSLNMWD